MIRLEEVLTSPRPLRECFAFAADFRHLTAWDPTALACQKRTPGPVGVGTAYDVEVAFGPSRIPMAYRVVEYDPPRRVVLEGEGGTVQARDALCFEPDGDGTRLRYTADISLAGGALVERLARPAVAYNGRRAIAGLTRALAAEGPAAAPSAWRDLLDRALLPGAARFTALGFKGAALPPVLDRLEGKTAVVTGATAGLGRASALALARLGARVVLVGRDAAKLEQVRAEIEADCGSREVAVQRADLGLVAEPRALAVRLLHDEPRLDVLVNNAGALFAERALTAEGLERTYALDLLSPYVLTEALLDRLAACDGRVVNVASGGMYLQALDVDDLGSAQGRFDGAEAYARAKRGLVALSADWAARHRGRVAFHAMHPGWADTPGVESALPGFHRWMRPLLRTPEQGADTIVWLAASPRVAAASGAFWLDRRPHLTEVLPGTAVAPDAVLALRAALARDAADKV
jgi:NAD(P)-dependent dehydrogenase (short-subunit alcohol dehydrogenase family)